VLRCATISRTSRRARRPTSAVEAQVRRGPQARAAGDVVQNAPRDQPPGFEQRIAGAHEPWLAKLRDLFVAQYVTPLGLQPRRADRPLDAVIVLFDNKTYAEYAKTTLSPTTFAPFANYASDIGAVVSFENSKPAGRSPMSSASRARAIRARHARALLVGSAVKLPLWIADGFGAYLGWHYGSNPTALDKREFRSQVDRECSCARSRTRTSIRTSRRHSKRLLRVTSFVEYRGKVRRQGRRGRADDDQRRHAAPVPARERVGLDLLLPGVRGCGGAA
jgi:hypothetical protein